MKLKSMTLKQVTSLKKRLISQEVSRESRLLCFCSPLEETIDDNSEMFIGGVCAYAQAVVSGIEDKHEEIDEIIASHLKKGWTLSRISKPSLAILRLAIYEMKYLDNVPQSVSINEAVELAKKYTIDESKFVNGILGTYSREFSGKSEK